jgi:flagellar biosynthetic protein FliO
MAFCCALVLCAVAAADDATATDSRPVVATPSSRGAMRAEQPPAADQAPPAEDLADTVTDIPVRTNPTDAAASLEQNLIGGRNGSGNTDGDSPWLSFLGPLVVVLGVMAVALWAARKFVPGVRRLGGSGAVRVMARTHLAPRQSIALVKVGSRVLVVGQTADRLTTLDTITDGDEVSHLLGLCHARTPDDASGAFQNVFRNVDHEFSAADEASRGASADAAAQDEPAAEPGLGRVRTQLDELARKVREVAGLRR